jgi:hypothetical protein
VFLVLEMPLDVTNYNGCVGQLLRTQTKRRVQMEGCDAIVEIINRRGFIIKSQDKVLSSRDY